jgi:hypothetical protein
MLRERAKATAFAFDWISAGLSQPQIVIPAQAGAHFDLGLQQQRPNGFQLALG